MDFYQDLSQSTFHVFNSGSGFTLKTSKQANKQKILTLIKRIHETMRNRRNKSSQNFQISGDILQFLTPLPPLFYSSQTM